MTPAALDPEAVRAWLAILHGDSPGQLHICSTNDWAGRFFNDHTAALRYITHLHQEGREGIYLRITTVTTAAAPGRRGGAADSAALPALWADLDLAGPGHAEHDLPPDEQAGRTVIAATGLPEPTLWIHSGGGLYPIWLLTQPWILTPDDLPAAKALAADWQRIIEHAAAAHGWRYGRGVGDLARVLRIPGTVNRKADQQRPCRIISAHPARYTVQQLQAALDAARTRIAPPAAPPQAAARLPTVDRPAGAISPGDDYATRTPWADILTPAGWTEHYRQDDVTYWTRPGKTTGISASTNALGTDRLHVFTTSAPPLDGGESYSKLGAYAALQHHGDHSAAVKALAAQGFGTPLPDPGIAHRQALGDILGYDPFEAAEHRQALADITGTPPPGPAPAAAPVRPVLDVSNVARTADWLRQEAGRGLLAGLFRRADTVVHTPREGEDGYLPLSEGDDEDGPAQIRPVNDSTVASRITYLYRCVRIGKDEEPHPALFPRSAARTALDVPDMLPNLRTLRGVIHSPVFRPDGTLIEAPGYDRATGLLHLPEPGLTVPPVPERPTGTEVTDAITLIGEMLSGFPFVTDHHRANYIGALITPLLRAMTPPPYKLHAIEAHQPGSGKTLLANVSRHIHGGVFRAEMPDDDTELRKQITAILSITTGPVVVLDNVSGALKSSTFAGLLTSAQWDDRPLGSTSWIRAANDRIWTITGNNLNVGGDLPRRTLRTVIDPGRPNPELRTDFAITDLEGWIKTHRGRLLAALLTIVRAWVAAGQPLPRERASDGYARWVRTIDGILLNAQIPGRFDDRSTQIEVGTDDDEWGDFLRAVHHAYGTQPWTCKELLADVDTGSLINPGRIPASALPGDLEAKLGRPTVTPAGLSKSLSRWLRNRDGRWAGGLAVRGAGDNGHDAKMWRIQTNLVAVGVENPGSPGSPGSLQSSSRPERTDPLHTVTDMVGRLPGLSKGFPEFPDFPEHDLAAHPNGRPA
jgi:hypothetical protein